MRAGARGLISRRLPWWLVLLLGVAAVVLGGVLTADPSFSLSVLDWLVAAALILTGLSELAFAGAASRPWLSRAVAAVWIVAGIVAVAWPGLTVRALAVVVGVGLIAGGAVRVWSALHGEGDERFVLGLSGVTNVVVGVLALSWPGVTVLVVAILFGVRTVLFGFGQIALALRLRRAPPGQALAERRWPRALRVIGSAAVLLVALAGAAVSAAIDRASPNAPGPFYTAPSPLPAGSPGTIIRSEVIDGFHAGATAYRVLYRSTGYDGKPTAVSGFIVVPDGAAPPQGRRVLAYTHGTVGVASNCAPSLVKNEDQQPLFVEGGGAFLAAGYVIAATDYQGLGTPGPHPYLIGASEAMNELDIVRAAHNLKQAQAGSRFAVWGHSQGGQAALFTGQLAASYGPDLLLVGVAAGGPVPNLVDMFKANIKTTIGKVLISMALRSWEQVYDDAHLDQIVTPVARPIVARLARNCLYSKNQILGSIPGSLALGVTFLHRPAWETEPWKTIALKNTPGGEPTKAPILIVQGGADTIVPPGVTERLVHELCQQGETVKLRLAPDVGHLETGHEAAPAVLKWINDRFAGKPAPTSCI
jgi:uncharacterized membrane protein HdeD (DUF308 family)/fermentation-respiration switch protein FrsA (DUF1100 family)